MILDCAAILYGLNINAQRFLKKNSIKIFKLIIILFLFFFLSFVTSVKLRQNTFSFNFIITEKNFIEKKNELSNYEWDLSNCPSKMFHNIYGIDPRTNHMTNPNLEQMAKVLYKVITTWNNSEFTKDNFFKNVVNRCVTSYEDVILHYVNTKLITNSIVLRKELKT
jgi:hypothetical protein